MTPPATTIPRATARLQLHKDFTLDDAAATVPYYAALGVSHLYASPILQARAGSTHGYDTVSHERVNPELGGEDALRRLVAELRKHGMALLLDIVPNHMGVGGSDNPWWLSVLEWGSLSPFADAFDIDWQRLGAGRYAGYTSRATTLTLALGSAPTAVSGAGVASYTYDAGQQQLQVVLRQASDFTVTLLTAGAAAGPLPVVLTDFAGQRQVAAVALRWHTASEQHNAGFEVQRRPATAADFATIGFVAGAGTTGQTTGYAFRDASAPAGPVYYRLRQLDHTGSATYSPVVAIAGAAQAAEATLLPVFPQPAHGALRVQVAGTEQPVTLRLLDGMGRVVHQQLCQSEAQVQVSGLPVGIYYLAATDAAGQPLAGRQKVVLQP